MFWHNKYVLYIGIPVAITLIAISISWFLRFLLNKFLLKSAMSLNVDRTKYNFLKNAVSSLIFVIALIVIFYIIPELRSLGLTLFAGAGIFAAILGLASQQAFSNIISGIFIVIFKPFRVGDNIKIDDKYNGIVEDITLRHTVICNFENRRVVIPNSVVSSETIINSSLTAEETIGYLEFGISYDSDVDLAIKIIQEEAEKHPYLIDGRTEEEIKEGQPKVTVRLIGFENSSVELRAYTWGKDAGSVFIMNCDLRKTIKKRFDHEGIEIPYPYRTLVFKDKDNTKRLQSLEKDELNKINRY